VKIHGQPLAFTWYVPIGVVITLLVGGGLSLTHPRRVSIDTAGLQRATGPR